jgi:hypothetical protein
MGIAQEKFGGINQYAIAVFSCRGESPQRGLGERIAHRAAFVFVIADRAIVEI